MSILDESGDKFVYDNRHKYYTTTFTKLFEPSEVLTVKCGLGGCPTCIGHKYNLMYGCPVCGDRSIEDKGYISICLSCGAAITTCGYGDVTAVGIPLIKSTEDII